MAKVSIIVPVYGVEKYIVKCMDSLVNQSFKDIEIIVVNDGTKDKSIELIKKNFDDNRIKIFNKENGGIADARNFGIKHVNSEYVLFVDPDDFIDKDMVKDMYETMISEKTDFAICDYYKYYDDKNKQHIPMIPFYDKDNAKCSVISMPGAVCKLFKKEVLIKYDIKFLVGKYFEDNAIMPFACAVSGNFSYIRKPYYYYLQRDGSILNKTKYDKRWEDIFDSLDNLYKKFSDYKLLSKFHDEIEYIYIEYLLHAANLRFIDYEEAYHNIKRVSLVLKNTFPKWKKNMYYKKENIKYKIICNLFYYNKVNLIKKLLRR